MLRADRLRPGDRISIDGSEWRITSMKIVKSTVILVLDAVYEVALERETPVRVLELFQRTVPVAYSADGDVTAVVRVP